MKRTASQSFVESVQPKFQKAATNLDQKVALNSV